MPAISDLAQLLSAMQPVLNPGTFVFATVPDGTVIDFDCVLASIREPEGLSIVVDEVVARRYGLSPMFRCAWITLSVNSDLRAVGLTAAFSTALCGAGVSCNVVAGAHHDHIFVPVESAATAMRELRALQSRSVR